MVTIYSKPDLRDELDELNEKLEGHSETKVAGFVVDTTPNLKEEIVARRAEIEDDQGIKIPILSFEEWRDRRRWN